MPDPTPRMPETGQEVSSEAPVACESRQISHFPLGPEIVTCFHDLEIGQTIEVTVNKIEHYGAFVDIDGVDCAIALIPIIEMSWARIHHPSMLLRVGQRILTRIYGISLNRSHVSLSMKALQPDPWLDIGTRYTLQSVTIGRVASIANYGVFVELEYGIEGLIHFSETVHTDPRADFGGIISIGQKIKVRILMIDPTTRRILLGIDAVNA